MSKTIMKHYTRLRAYQLGESGSSFSYSVGKHFTLIEARYNVCNAEHIKWEMKQLGISRISRLHITSWDNDHCRSNELEMLLYELRPRLIEYPGHNPETKNGVECLNMIMRYTLGQHMVLHTSRIAASRRVRFETRDVLYNPLEIRGRSNDNSVVKFFRVGTFTVLSLGDCESTLIRDRLMKELILQSEVDVMILAHHGADNGFTTTEFLRAIKPRIAICSSNYKNKYNHPERAIRNRLRQVGIPYFSTKTGDVIVQSVDNKHFMATNYIANDTKKQSCQMFENKLYYNE